MINANPVTGFQIAETGLVSDNTLIGFYLVYAVIAVALVIFLARTLSAYGGVFLRNVFESDEVAEAVNKLLVVGFYLLNLGYALMIYRLQANYDSLVHAFNDLVVRLGILLLSLGVIHLVNIAIFWQIRRSAAEKPTGTQMLAERLAAKVETSPTPRPPARPAMP